MRRFPISPELLERLYLTYHRPEFIHPDPLETVKNFDDPADREVAALIAGTMAYGRVQQILKTLSVVFEKTGKHPARYLKRASRKRLEADFEGFVHRFADAEKTVALLFGIGAVLRKHGSLKACFLSEDEGRDIRQPLGGLVRELRTRGKGDPGHLLPEPGGTSACKRLHLMLRWLVREDAIDPGDWKAVGAHRLVIPVDVHMHRIATRLGLTRRKSADIRAALEITEAFSVISPEDPVKYDFVLTRLGIHPDLEPESFIRNCLESGECFPG